MRKKVVDAHYARSPDYRKVLESIEREGKCPFCPDNFKYHQEKILRRSGDWLITKNSWSYKKAQHRLLIICTVHKEHLAELTVEDMAAVLRLAKWAVRKFAIAGGALAFRFGDTARTGATVCHLHAHLIVPKINKRTGRAEPVLFPIG